MLKIFKNIKTLNIGKLNLRYFTNFVKIDTEYFPNIKSMSVLNIEQLYKFEGAIDLRKLIELSIKFVEKDRVDRYLIKLLTNLRSLKLGHINVELDYNLMFE